MPETHPFGSFVPSRPRYLFLGTFIVKMTDPSYDWFFASKRNQFWSILSEVYQTELRTKLQKQSLFTHLRMAITDVILQCDRSQNTNADNNLINLVFNIHVINKIIRENNIQKIFLSSRYAETLFKRNFKNLIKEFPQIKLVTLPSSSPRYAAISKAEKINRYRQLLPKLSRLQIV